MAVNLRLHHFGILVKNIEESSKRYAHSFGYQVRTDLIHDPLQTAYVQFLFLPGEQILLELISPDGPASTLQNALNKSGGIHHVCYATSDLSGAIHQLQEDGNMLVKKPKPAVAFDGRKIAWLMTKDYLLYELVEQGQPGQL